VPDLLTRILTDRRPPCEGGRYWFESSRVNGGVCSFPTTKKLRSFEAQAVERRPNRAEELGSSPVERARVFGSFLFDEKTAVSCLLGVRQPDAGNVGEVPTEHVHCSSSKWRTPGLGNTGSIPVKKASGLAAPLIRCKQRLGVRKAGRLEGNANSTRLGTPARAKRRDAWSFNG
jgi:hypothetical protein